MIKVIVNHAFINFFCYSVILFLMVFLGLIFLLMIILLLVPIRVVVNTISGEYYIQWKGIAKVNFESHDEKVLRIHLRFFFFNSYFYPLEYKRTKLKKKSSKSRRQFMGSGLKKYLQLLKSFKLKKLYINIDTGNYCLNAQMYPLLMVLNQSKVRFNINFHRKNQLVFYLQNRPIYLLKSIINF